MRILSAAAFVVLVAAGCGGAARPQRSAVHELPRAMAQDWERQASAIATAAAAGNDCHALQLANALRADVRAAQGSVPSRLRAPLVNSVNELADRIVCKPPPQTVPMTRPPKKPPHHHGPGKGHHHHHGHGDEGGDQG